MTARDKALLCDLSADFAREILHYNSLTGSLTWRRRIDVRECSNARYEGKIAGTVDERGYLKIGINKRIYKAHRLIWLIMTGAWPSEEIDHINGDGGDNRWVNLRQASRLQNTRNVKTRSDCISGYRGVWWDSVRNKWRSRIKISGKTLHLGAFLSIKEAISSYATASFAYHGEYGATGRSGTNVP